MRISELCEVHSGYTARGRLEPLAKGGILALQLRDVGAVEGPLEGRLQRYDISKLSDRHMVRGGEVVFRSRGESNTAVALTDVFSEPVAVILPLVILRPDRERILAEYLAWSINQPDAQRKLTGEAQGTSLRMIPIAALERLDIAVPDVQTQRLIVEINALNEREGRLWRALAVRRSQLVSAMLDNVAKTTGQEEII